VLLEILGPLGLLSVIPAHVFGLLVPAAIPIWSNYVDFMEWLLDSLGDIFRNGGLAIIAFTIIVKTLMLPLTIKSTRSSKAMQELAPKIKEIQKKHGNDRQKASQETFALYSQHGVNPMSGCLPMLIQMPIFFGLYRAISNLSHGHHGMFADGFLWLHSLNAADPYKILPILAGVFQFVQSRMMRPSGQKITDPQQQVMNTMMNFMPLMVVMFGWNFASGPVIYWATQSIYSVIQQWFITGWGSLGDWFPWLPELPEHRRLGYVAPRNLDDITVVSGEPAEQKGIGGWLNRKMREAQATAEARQNQARQKQAARGGSQPAPGNRAATQPSTDPIDVETRPARKGTSYQDRVNAATRNRSRQPVTSANGTRTGVDPNPNSKASKKARRRNVAP